MAQLASGSIDLQSLKVASTVATGYITNIEANQGITIKALGGTTSGSSANYIKLNSDGLEIYRNGNAVASYGENIIVGPSNSTHISITPSAIAIGSNFSATADGTLTATNASLTNASIINGSININTSSQTLDVIKLNWTGIDAYNINRVWRTALSPQYLTFSNSTVTSGADGHYYAQHSTEKSVIQYLDTDMTILHQITINPNGVSVVGRRSTTASDIGTCSLSQSGIGVGLYGNINVKTSINERGVLLHDNANFYGGIYDNGSNLWIGATGGATIHHRGGTYISSGWNTSSNAANTTIYVSVPKARNASGLDPAVSNYGVFHSGNLRYITDRGNSNDWHYTKWSDGYTEMWKRILYSDLAMTTAAGNLYRSAAKTASYPSGFFDTAAFPQLTCLSASSTLATMTSNSTSGVSYYIAGGSSATRDVTVYIYVWGY